MTRRRGSIAIAAMALVMAGCPALDERPPPTITAQGFAIEQPHEARVGRFADVRLRIEAPAGIEHLTVHERSFEIDLAKSPEASRFRLFGLERRVWSKRDVTLDLAEYLNQKLSIPGEYALALTVADRAARQTSVVLPVVVLPEPGDTPTEATTPSDEGDATSARPDVSAGPDRALDEGVFRLERVGRGPVTGGERFGLTWKTVDEIAVVVRMTGREGGEAHFARLDPADYAELTTSEALARALEPLEPASTLEIATANDAAAGTVIAIVRPDARFVLLAEQSATSLSERGTTVTLSGRYRR